MKALLYNIILIFALTNCQTTYNYTESYRYKYTKSIGLMMSQALDSLKLAGHGIRIGVIDAGFGGFYKNDFTKGLHVSDYKDFIDDDTTGFFGENEHEHGTIVTTSIGGKYDEFVHGLAYNATYFLAKTEDVSSELKAEETRLISAVDWLISNEVDIINISIAYATFDDVEYYTQSDLDGQTALSSSYIDSVLNAHPELIITVSAGNRGDKEWENIMFPSDVKEVITVGSTNSDGLTRRKTSGIGPEHVEYIKPDVVTFPIPKGNSHTTPVIAGLCALMKEFKPNLERKELIDAIHSTSSNSEKPNREIGYGVPNSHKLLMELQ